MNKDRELLELAALAVGIEYDGFSDERGCDVWWIPDISRYEEWSPMDSDGDNRRLQLACNLALVPFPGEMVAMHKETGRSWAECLADHGDDPCATARFAVFRAAAEIGKKMKEQGK